MGSVNVSRRLMSVGVNGPSVKERLLYVCSLTIEREAPVSISISRAEAFTLTVTLMGLTFTGNENNG